MNIRFHSMKNPISLPALVFFSVFAMLVSISGAGDHQPATKLHLEQTVGQVRVIMLRVGRTVPTNSPPQFVVTYGVEVPMKGAFSDLAFRSDNQIALFEGGKPLDSAFYRSGTSMGFKDLPRQNELSEPTTPEGRAMIAEEEVFVGVNAKTRRIDIRIQFSWRGRPMRFDFKDVPVN